VTPNEARKAIEDRMAWLALKLEKDPGRHMLKREWEALNMVQGMLYALGANQAGGEARHREVTERVERSRQRFDQQRQRCTCERCPVHSTGDKT
jgi:hypothetical protein